MASFWRQRSIFVPMLAVTLSGPWVGCHRAPAPKLGVSSAASDDDAIPGVTPGVARTAIDLRQSIDANWLFRDDPNVMQTLLPELEELALQEPHHVALLARLSHACFLGAVHARGQRDDAQTTQLLMRGMLVGEAALHEAYPDNDAVIAPVVDHLAVLDAAGMDAVTWYVSNLGAYAARGGVTTQLFYRERMRAALSRMLQVDENYLYGTPHRYWAIYLARAPAFAGGSMGQARLHFERALRAGPDYFANACDFAQFYAVPTGDRALFERLLAPVLTGDPNLLADVAPEQRLNQARAQSLHAQVESLF